MYTTECHDYPSSEPLLRPVDVGIRQPQKKERKRKCGLKNGSNANSQLEKTIFKLYNVKCALKLITCCFDDQLLHLPGLISGLASRVDAIIANNPGPVGYNKLPITRLPAPILPHKPSLNGPQGEVPIPYSFSWTRYEPRIHSTSEEVATIELDGDVEPEVVVLVPLMELKRLCLESSAGSTSCYLDEFGSQLMALYRPVTCVFLTSPRLNIGKAQLARDAVKAISNLHLAHLSAQLQLEWNVRATPVCSTVDDLVTLLVAYTRSIAERPFKTGRLDQDHGWTFHPDTVRMGLSGRSAGAPPSIPYIHSDAVTSGDKVTPNSALYEWARKVWLAQLGQWRGVTGEIANAIVAVYPTARAFYNACTNTSSTQVFTKQLAELEIRRGVGVLTTTRRLGPEMAGRLVAHFITLDPDQLME